MKASNQGGTEAARYQEPFCMAPRTKNKLGPCPAAEKRGADNVLAHGIEAAETMLTKLETLPKAQRNDWWYSSVAYWKNVRAGCQWLRGQNRRRRIVDEPAAETSSNSSRGM